MSDAINAIDKAIQAAQARKAAKMGLPTEQTEVRVSHPNAERVVKSAEREAVRLEKKAAREAAKLARQSSDSRVPHMRKVEKAEARLPQLDDRARLILNEITTNFSAATVAAIAAHLQHFNRVKATERALAQPLKVGTKVKIIAGDQRFIGLEGVVSKSQRIRCYVTVAGRERPIYLFTSDVEAVGPAAAAPPKAVNG